MKEEWTWTQKAGWTACQQSRSWEEGTGLEEFLCREGYEPSIVHTEGSAASFQVGALDLWSAASSHARHVPYRYCCLVTLPGDEFAIVWIAHAPDLFDFLRAYTPMGWTVEAAATLSRIEGLLDTRATRQDGRHD